jgi:nickel/cobalt transporter (NicO) family protein
VSVSLPSLYQVFFGALGGSGTGVMWAMLVSLVLGAVHALSPGHGKALVVASLMGSRGSLRRAFGLAITVAVTHTASVLILALIVVVANARFLPAQLTPLITLGVAILTVVFGVDLTRRAIKARAGSGASDADHHHHADHDHGTDHTPHEHGHGELATSARGFDLSWRYTLSVGVLGGLVPNATALVVVLMAGTFGQIETGILVVVCYGAGIASVLTAIGVGSIVLRRRGRETGPGDLVQRLVAPLPLISGLIVVAVGVVLSIQAAITL